MGFVELDDTHGVDDVVDELEVDLHPKNVGLNGTIFMMMMS